MMTRRISIILTMLACLVMMPATVSAQRLRIKLYHTDRESGRKVAAQNVNVYSFLLYQQAKKSQDLMKQYELPNKRSGYNDMGKSNAKGELELLGRNDGFLLINAETYIDDESFAILLDLRKENLKADPDGITFEVEYTIPDAQKKNGDGMGTTTMASKTSVLGRQVRKKKPTTKAIINGKDVTFKSTVYIDSVYAREDARFVVSPFLVVPAENNDTVGYFPPRVMDGHAYRRTMRRRMGFNFENDKLNKYRVLSYRVMDLQQNELRTSRYMQPHKNGMFEFQQTIHNFDFSRHYNCLGHYWYEDYNHVYHEGIMRLWNGNFTNYNRYLDWESARTNVELTGMDNYYRVGKAESKTHPQSYHMEFERGDAKLNMADSATVLEIERLKNDIRRIYDATDGSMMTQDTIIGYASPEGSVSGNKALADRRSRFLYDQVLRPSFPSTAKFPTPHFESKVVPWTEVADTLDVIGDTLSARAASEIRQICKENTDMVRQEAAIKRCSWYDAYVLPDILPRMRRLEFTYQSVTFAVRTPDEIYEMYRTNASHREGTGQRDYEYYELMNRLYELKDYEGLERIARQALKYDDLMEEVTRRDTLGSEQDSLGDWRYIYKEESPVYKRPYPLAAYYLAQCLLHRGAVDTKLLDQFIDFSHDGKPWLKKNFYQEERGYWNDEAIVLTQVMMLCQDNDYTRANQVLDDHLPEDDPRFTRLRIFLRAMKSEYDDTQVRDTVATSSPMNFLVAWCGYAEEAKDPQGYHMAMNLISDNMDPIIEKYPYIEEQWDGAVLDSTDARVLYMKAICLYKTRCTLANQDDDAPLFISKFMLDDFDPDGCWARPMLDACLKDPSNAEYLKTDGNFNDSYRTLVLYFYNRIKEGATMEQAKAEYDQLVAKYRKNTK